MIIRERPMTCWSPYSHNASVNSTCPCPQLESSMFSCIWIENHMHVKSWGLLRGWQMPNSPGRAKFANAPPLGLTRRAKYPAGAH